MRTAQIPPSPPRSRAAAPNWRDLMTRAGARERLLVLLVLAFVHGLVYAAVIPPWQAPDETGHFEYAWLLARLGRTPAAADLSPELEQELLASLYEWRYGILLQRPLPEQMPERLADLPRQVYARAARTVLSGRFSLAYAWQALFLLPVGGQDLVAQLFAARLSSVLLNLGVVWLSWLLFGELFPRRTDLALLATSAIVLLPQHTFVNSTVGDGVLAELMAVLVLWCWVRLFRHGFDPAAVMGILAGTAAGVMSKNTAAFLIPLDLALGVWWVQRRTHRLTWKHLLYLGAAALLVGGGLWVWSHTPLGLRALSVVRRALVPSAWAWTDQRGMALGEALLGTYDSFWANFGWMSLPLSQRWYGALALLGAIALWGWGRKSDLVPAWSLWMMGGTMAVALGVHVWVALLSRQGAFYQFQGRYLYPVLAPFVFILVGGLANLGSAPTQRRLAAALFALLLFVDTWGLALYILPFFYG